MSPEILVSAIIPAYNRAHLLAETVESVFSQRDTRFEVILVDDGSTDSTPEVAHRWGNRLQYVRQDNQGVAAARNHGIRLARGMYVSFLDSDDLWTVDKIEQDLKAFERQPHVAAVYGGKRILRGSRVGRPILPPSVHKQFLESLSLKNFLCAGAVTVQREALLSVGGFAEGRTLGPSADWELWVRLAARYPFGPTEAACLLSREHPANMMHDALGMEKAMAAAVDGFLADAAAGPPLRPSEHRIRSRVLLYAAVGYYGCGDTGVALKRLKTAMSLDRGVVFNPLWSYTLARSLLGARVSSRLRRWKISVQNAVFQTFLNP